jgi:hypothetical protein
MLSRFRWNLALAAKMTASGQPAASIPDILISSAQVSRRIERSIDRTGWWEPSDAAYLAHPD